MFKRGKGAVASILIPSRGRPDALKATVASLLQTAYAPWEVELLFAVDQDDQPTVEMVRQLLGNVRGKMIVAPRGRGFLDMHHRYNDLAVLATGDWLGIFNDCSEMRTEHWDHKLWFCAMPLMFHSISEIFYLYVSGSDGQSCPWGFLRREAYKVLGHVSQSPAVDHYVYLVMKSVHSAFPAPFEIVRHGRPGADGIDGTKDDVDGAHRAFTMTGDVYNMEAQQRDCAKLAAYIRAEQERLGCV